MARARTELLEHVVRLGREFKRRGMHQHATKLRIFYLLLKKGMATRENAVDVHWTEGLTIEWMRTLRPAPFDRDLRLRTRGSPCPRCAPHRRPTIATELTFPGGARMKCQSCAATWLEADEAI